jgi:DNA-binding MarR family transcriptional regulator
VRRQYDADRGIRTGYYYYDGLGPVERDELMVKLHHRGWSQSKIAPQLGITQQGVSKALRRCAAGRIGRDARG